VNDDDGVKLRSRTYRWGGVKENNQNWNLVVED